MQIIGIIPARLGSSRLPNKVLLPVKGKPILYWVVRACSEVKAFKEVLVATDSKKVIELVRSWGGEAVLTSAKCRNGTERVAEVSSKKKASYYVNVQADQPFISPRLLRRFTGWLQEAKPEVGTMATLLSAREGGKRNVVKVALGEGGRCLYFSRLPIPFSRDGKPVRRYKHIGVYAYRKRALAKYMAAVSPVAERAEKLEQLRFLSCGIAVYALVVRSDVQAVDTRNDLRRFSKSSISSARYDKKS